MDDRDWGRLFKPYMMRCDKCGREAMRHEPYLPAGWLERCFDEYSEAVCSCECAAALSAEDWKR